MMMTLEVFKHYTERHSALCSDLHTLQRYREMSEKGVRRTILGSWRYDPAQSGWMPSKPVLDVMIEDCQMQIDELQANIERAGVKVELGS